MTEAATKIVEDLIAENILEVIKYLKVIFFFFFFFSFFFVDCGSGDQWEQADCGQLRSDDSHPHQDGQERLQSFGELIYHLFVSIMRKSES